LLGYKFEINVKLLSDSRFNSVREQETMTSNIQEQIEKLDRIVNKIDFSLSKEFKTLLTRFIMVARNSLSSPYSSAYFFGAANK
jgi:hypothetical protein